MLSKYTSIALLKMPKQRIERWHSIPNALSLLFLLLICPLPSSGQGYGSYGGVPIQGVGEGSAINGGEQQSGQTGAAALGSNIRKAPVAPIAPPRIPLFPSDGSEENSSNGQSQAGTSSSSATGPNSVNYRPAPPPVRREARSEGQCRFDGTKWQMHPQSAAANAVMFDRSSGISCDECLALCSNKFQDHSTEWICRSASYDHRWKICDLFAVNGTEKPYFLLDYEGRDYFEYMAALPPTDGEMLGISRKEVREFEQNSIGAVTPAPSSSKSIARDDADASKQCSCPCKALAELTAQSLPLALNGSSEEGKNEAIAVAKQANSTELEQPAAALAPAQNTARHLAGVRPLPVSSISYGGTGGANASQSLEQLPLALAEDRKQTVALEEATGITSEPLRVHPSLATDHPLPAADISKALENAAIPPEAAAEGQKRPNEEANSSASSDSDLLVMSSSSSAPTQPTEASSSPPPPPPLISLSSESSSSSSSSESSTQSSSSSAVSYSSAQSLISQSSSINSSISSQSSSSFSSETITITNTSSLSSSSSDKEEVVASNLANSRRAFASKTFQPHKEIRVPFRKTLEKVSRVEMRHFTEQGEAVEKKAQQKAVARSSACPRTGQIAHYVEIRGRLGKRNGKVELAKEAEERSPPSSASSSPSLVDARKCMDACDSPGQLPICNSAQLSSKGCELSSSAVNYTATDSLIIVPKNAAEGTKYLEKICLEPGISKSEKRRIFTAIPGFILVGHVQEVANAGSLAECLKYCLMAEADYGFVCKSLMYYPADLDQNCLMNSESRHSQADVFVPEDQSVNMLYVDMERQRGPPSIRALPEDEHRRFRDSPLEASQRASMAAWTRWSKCLNATENTAEMRHRYLKCKEAKDVRKCPKESVPCKRMPPLRIQRIWRPEAEWSATTAMPSKKEKKVSDCLAVRDALGMKRCPYGMRWNGSQREFCTPPVDC